MDAPRRVVLTYYALTGAFNLGASLIWGVNTLFLLDAGLSIVAAFGANAAFTAGQVLFEIPTGVVADTRGRRLSFLLSASTLLVGTLAYVALAGTTTNFLWWALASVLLGLGFTFYSGAVEAWFVDAYQAAGGKEPLDGFFARAGQIFGVAMLIGTTGGGLLGSIHLSIPYYVRAGLLLGMFVVGYRLMHDEGFTTRSFQWRHVPQEVAAVGRASWRHGWMDRRVRLLMMMTFLHMGFLMWGWYAWQPYFLELLGQNLIWVAGIIAALVSVTMIAGNQVVRALRGRFRRGTILAVCSAVFSVCMLGVGWVASFWAAVPIFLLGMLFFGILGPTKQAAIHALIPNQQRATIISFDGLLGSAGAIGSQVGLAELAENRGYAAGYLLGGAVTLLAVPVALLFRNREPRRGRDPGPPPVEDGLPGGGPAVGSDTGF